MLGFFQRHQKSLMLVLLAPALIGMGITGAIMSVMTDPGDSLAGKVFEEEVSQKRFAEIRRLHRASLSQGAEEEETWRFYAMVRAADRAGLAVSESEVGQQIHQQIGLQVARIKAMEELRRLKIDTSTREGQDQFRKIMFRHLFSKRTKEFKRTQYRDAVRASGLSVRDYERQQIREALVQRYLETLRELATVSPDEVWKAYQDKHHRRILELVEIPAAKYVPQEKAKEGTSGYVSDDQVKLYYLQRKRDYDEPRRVDMEYLALPFEDAERELKAPKDTVLLTYNKLHGIVPVGSFTKLKDKVRNAWFKEKGRDRVSEIMDAVADAVDQAKLDKQPIKLKEIAAQVGKTFKSEALIHGSTGLKGFKHIEKSEEMLSLIKSFAAKRWFRVGKKGKASDVLGSDKGWFVLVNKEIKYKKVPAYKAVKAQARKDYSAGSDAELQRHYDEFKGTKDRKDESWRVEAVVAYDAEKKFGDHKKARAALEKARELGRKWHKKKKSFPFERFESDADIPVGLVHIKATDLARKELEGHEVYGEVASEVRTRGRWKLSGITELKGKKKGWMFYRMIKPLPRGIRPFEKVKKQVREDVLEIRSVERAEQKAKDNLDKLRHKSGDELAAAIKELGFRVITTEPFDRKAVSLKEVADAGDLVAEAFSAQAKVGGPYSKAVPDIDNNRVLLLRVKAREDAGGDSYNTEYPRLRKDLLRKKRNDYAEAQVREMTLLAKGITKEHLDFAQQARDGKGGVTKLKLRQIFLPPDPEILSGWIDTEAMKIIDEAKKAILAKTPWEVVVDRFSEDSRTRGNAGELPPAGRGDFATDFGNDFEEAVFSLPRGHISEPVKSKAGFHLVRLVKILPNKQKVFQHLLVKTDPKTRKLPEAMRVKAEAASKAKLEAALAKLDAGKPFGAVAEEVGFKHDELGQGKEFEISFVTHLERLAMAEFLEYELPETHPKADDEKWLPEIVEVPGSGYHLFACGRDATEKQAAWEGKRRNRTVYHIQSNEKQDVEAARKELLEFIEANIKKDEDRPSWLRMLGEFQKLARKRSKAASAKKGGSLGLVKLENSIRGYGDEFLKRACYKDDGSPVGAGHRTKIFRGEKGFHLVWVVSVEVVKADDKTASEKRRSEVAEELLAGTDWK